MSKKKSFMKLFQMKPYSKKFYKAQQDFFNLTPNIEGLKQIGINRKTNYEKLKPLMKMTDVFEYATNESNYLTALKERDVKLLSGEYLQTRAANYINNYLKSIKAMTIDDRIKDYLDKNPSIILEGLLPEIDNYYVYISSKSRTSKGRSYRVNTDEATFFENQIIDVLKEHYGVDLGITKKEDIK